MLAFSAATTRYPSGSVLPQPTRTMALPSTRSATARATRWIEPLTAGSPFSRKMLFEDELLTALCSHANSVTVSATHAGLSDPAHSIVTLIVARSPWWVGSTDAISAPARTLLSAGTMAGNRTLFNP